MFLTHLPPVKMPIEVKFTIKYTGGAADDSVLDLYDAATSIHGLAKALAITTHALTTQGKVRSRGDSIPNVKFYLHPPRQGSFIEIVTILFEEPVVKIIGASVVVASFWDMLEFTWKQATGGQKEPNGKIAKRIIKDDEKFPEKISKALEVPLQQLHRPIAHDSRIVIEIKRPKIGTIVTLNEKTLSYITETKGAESIEGISGNVTKYNILSGIGRFYDDEEGRTIPFIISPDLTIEEREILTQSLHNSNADNRLGKILVDAEVTRDRLGKVIKYIIAACQTI